MISRGCHNHGAYHRTKQRRTDRRSRINGRATPNSGPSVAGLGRRATYRRLLTSILVLAAVPYLGCQGDVTAPPSPVATNAAPQLAGSIPPQTVYVGERVSVDLATHFSDPDGDALTYAVATSDSAVVALALSGSVLGVVGRSQGVATVTATARDPGGLAAEHGFEVMVPNRAPEALGGMAERAMAAGDTATLDVSAYFADPDGDALEYTAASSDGGTATVSMHGDVLEIVAVRWGAVTVTVTARDGGGLEAEQALSVVGANRMPELVALLPDVEVEVGGEVVIVASRYFGDPDGDALVYRAEALDADVVGVVVGGDTVTVVGLGRGRVAVVVAARDAGGLAAHDTMGVVVPNQAPVVVESLPDVVLDEGADTVVVLSRYFRDPDGDELTYRATSSEPWSVDARVAVDSLAIEIRAPGKAVITVTAADSGGLIARQDFNVVSLTDRDVLEILYHATGGQGWTNSENWLTDAPLRDWYGITADHAERVGGIVLMFNKLRGMIPPELGQLARLDSLFLDHNGLTGLVPVELSKLSSVSYMSLTNNQLAGSIPSELGQLPNLRYLHLSGNKLAGRIPSELGRLPRLERLNLSYNQLKGPIPSELHRLSNLTSIYLHGNELIGPIPSELGQLPRVEHISLFGNDLTGAIPPALGKLSGLKSLQLHHNHLTGSIPSELGRLSNMTYLSLYDNELTGPIPSALGQLSALEWLNLRGNHLTGPIPAELGQLTRLRELYLYDNHLTGPIPAELGRLLRLTNLWLRNNRLTGAIPAELGQLSSLIELHLSANELTGPIPSELGRLSNLQMLSLEVNELTGPIPAALGQLSVLNYLYVTDNQLTGSIPAALGQLSNLRVLGLSGNELTGPIPSELGRLSQLVGLGLYENELGGPIPSELGQLSNLTGLYLHANKLTGRIPSTLNQLYNVRHVWLNHNGLSGPIPSELGQLSSLASLQLQHNQLTGRVPDAYLELDMLKEFHFGTNNGLCAPDTKAFRTWLNGLTEYSGPFCPSTSPPPPITRKE